LFQSAGSANNNEDHDETAEDNDHDPHFEPIVPLPELVDVKTGEEEEEVIFKHRAKVYRYNIDNKEWKERGVGDIKILKHPHRKTFRVLLRRDQVYKVACNHLISVEMQLKAMASSETAWCWYAMDYSEGNEEGSLDQLAVRFKTKDTAEDFKSKFEACQKELSSKEDTEQSTGETKGESLRTWQNSGNDASRNRSGRSAEPYGTTENNSAWRDEEEYEEYNEEEDDDYNAPMFEAKAKLSIKEEGSTTYGPPQDVDFRILYDDSMFGALITARLLDAGPEDADICEHVITMQTNLEDDLSWSALDYMGTRPVRRWFKVNFDSKEEENDFKDVFEQGKDFANQCEIMENPEQMYYHGVGGDHDDQ